MFNQFTELFQTSLKPIEQLVELNISTASTVAHQQGLLVASLIDDSISFSQNMPITADVNELIAQQSKFNAEVQSQLTDAIKQTSGTIIKAKKDAEIIFSESFSVFTTKANQTSSEKQPLVPKLLIKEKPLPVSNPQAEPKAAVKSEPKAAVKAEPKAAVKSEPKAAVKAKPKAAVKAEPKAVVKAKPKAVVKAKPKAAVKAKPKAAVKAEPKAAVKATPAAEVKTAP